MQELQKTEYPTDPKTGLTLPLRTSLGSQGLAQHRAMVAVEMEVLAKKFDRFGWDRDRGTAASDRLILDWMDALQDYPLSEIRDACRAAVIADPKNMPNEGHIVAKILDARRVFVSLHRKPVAELPPPPRATKEEAANLVKKYGFEPKTFGGAR